MRAAVILPDLLLFSRIEGAAGSASILRVDTPAELPATASFDLLLVDWSAREPGWEVVLHERRAQGSRVILFGPHTDVDAHRAAAAAGLGPMWARSKLLSSLPTLFGDALRGATPAR